jgi:hypothetical protein
MKRQIKFRGYNLKNKKWLYGYYLVNRGKHYIVQDEVVEPFSEPSDFEVDPESVGQFVAIVKGVELYEGDYILYKHSSSLDGCCETSIKTRHMLKYNPKFAQIVLYCIDERYTCCGDSFRVVTIDEEQKTSEGYIRYKEEYEVIGNEYEEKLR